MTMTEMPNLVIETLSDAHAADVRADLLADVLSHVRLTGALFMLGRYSAPWAIDTPGNCALVDLLSPDAERLLVFHLVRKGRLTLTSNGHSVELTAGDLAILPNSDRHVMGGGKAAATPIAELLPPTPWNEIPVLEFGGGGETTELVCGYFGCDELLFNAFLRSLPPVFVVHPRGTAAALLNAATDHAVADGSRSGGETAMRHVTQMLLSEALRLYAEQTPASAGWLAATADPVVGRALKLLHDDPGHDWSIEALARAAHTSRSVLGGRFKTLLGQSPMRYLVEWRMQLASELLRMSDLKVADIAERSGYGSEAAFSRAFARHLGLPPAQWRDAQRGRFLQRSPTSSSSPLALAE